MTHFWFAVAHISIPIAGAAVLGWAVLFGLRRVGATRQALLGGRLSVALAWPLGLLAFVVTVRSGLALWRPAAQASQGPLFILAVIAMAILVDRLIGEAVSWHLRHMADQQETTLPTSLAPLAQQLLRGLLFFLGLVVILSDYKVNVSAFVATATVATLAFSLAAQDTLANLFAGVTILFDRPFRVGDRVEVSGVVGDVTRIGLRSTHIRTFNNNIMVVPNKDVTASQLTNRAYPNLTMALQATVGVGYSTDISEAKRLILQVAHTHPEVLTEPAPNVYFTAFGNSSLNLELWAYVGDYRRLFAVLSDINEGILTAFRAAGIEIPFPQRVLTMAAAPQRPPSAPPLPPPPDLSPR